MGVQGLWELLAPVGRRVSVETLAGKRLAIDASIWMIQFMKAMRDEKGEMVRNAHILGFFRRICKLLFLRTKPVFVFDGGTPALKRRTVVARRRQRENAQAKIRKTAEKLLLNHLKTMRLKDLADDLENQRRENGGKGKKVITDETKNALAGTETVPKSYNQEAVDEMLAASLAAEGEGGFTCDASTSGMGIVAEDEDEDEDEDEEMVLPNLQGKVDPDVLAALPPSMQLDLLVQMRERLMAENREKYQKVKKAPAKFSELQIQAYLKTVAFRREINEVQKSAGGRGIGGVQTSRIASEANREFIFSSSFTGDRQVLASAGVNGNRNGQIPITKKHPTSNSVDDSAPMKNSNAEILSSMDEPTRPFHEDVETYLDDRGRVRVSKVRAMGIRMTRDLQRNLELMKEIEQQREEPMKSANNKFNTDGATVGVPGKLSVEIDQPEISHQGDDGTLTSNRKKDDIFPITGTSIEVSFDDDNQQKIVDSYDDLFAQIAAGDPVASFSNDNSPLRRQTSDSALDCEWEQGANADFKIVNKSPPTGDGMSGESEVEWEEDAPDIPEQNSLSRTAYGNADSKGALEEEADIQEAIRRSIKDLQSQKDIESGSEKLKDNGNLAGKGVSFGSFYLEEDKVEPRLPLDNGVQSNEPSVKVESGFVERLGTLGEINILATDDSPGTSLMNEPCESHLKCQLEISTEDASGDESSRSETGCIEPIIPIAEKSVNLTCKLLKDDSTRGGEMLICTKLDSGVSSHTSDSLMVDTPDITVADSQQSEFEVALNDQSKETPESMESFAKVASASNLVQNFDEKRDWSDLSAERVVASGTSCLTNRSKEQVKTTEACLEEEMLKINKEQIDLGKEQRKLERNAESVSSEMFAECQELLQMFGLPYIIAPMEAEAQCAYMELEKLVDGVVTDDSDVLLFGARSVFKNIFDDRKYVETYFMEDIENELGLTREKLIRMALLLGSDYTEGVSGIGIVNAVEVLTAFPEDDGLQKFREWIESPDPTILGKATPRKKGSNSSSEGASAPNQSVDGTDHAKQIFMDKHRNVSKNWHIPSSFPSEAVISAYASPQVDRSTEPFSWGKPDLFILRKLCWEKFGWGTQKADELLQPVLKEYNKHETQLRLEAFYTFNERFAKIRSKRISKAVKGITGNKSVELVDDSARDAGTKKRKVRHKEENEDKNKELSCSIDGTVIRDNTYPAETPAGKQSRKTKTLESSVGERGSRSGRGRVRGRNKGQLKGRGRSEEKSILEFGGTSSDDDNNCNDDQEGCSELYEGSRKVRRSTRARKAVKYAVDDFEIDNADKRNEDPVDAAAAADLGGSNHHELGDPSIENNLLWDNLEMGGEFCMAEAALELNTQVLDHNRDTVPMEESSKEYLHMGGGFCLEEDEVEESSSSQARTTSIENPGLSHGSGLVEEAERDIGTSQMDTGPVKELNETRVGGKTEASESRQELCSSDAADDSRVALSRDNIEKDDSEATRPTGFLSAMPNLRRKRRKS